jgi:formate-dependent nitrite reductase cytochrome c552 subunit
MQKNVRQMNLFLAILCFFIFVCCFGLVRNGAANGNLDSIHAKKNVTCVDCHGPASPAKGDTVENDVCVKCHGTYDTLAAKTINPKVPNRNPHKSHLGEIDCVVCHMAHKPSEAYCNGCHVKYNMKIPAGRE